VRDGFQDVNGLLLRRPSSYAREIKSLNPGRLGRLRFLGAGCREGPQALRYSEWVQQFDWSDFYARWAGAAYIDFFRKDLTAGQAVVLIDSRTGVTEHGGVCTHHLADLVVLLSAPNDLNIEGTKRMADLLANADIAALRKNRPLQVMPVAGRVETSSQVAELDAFRKRFEAEFARKVPAAAGDGRAFIQATEIPYIPYFAFTEKVVARETATSHRELYRAYEALTRAIVNVGLEAGLLAPPLRRGFADERHVEQAEDTLGAILDRHRLWITSGYTEGARAVLRGRDLSRQELAGAELSDADLTEARFVQADLQGCRLVGATLRGAVLRGARLDRAELSGADLRGADLANAVLPDSTFDLANLQDSDLEGADAAGATWRGALLVGARLNRANLFGADLTRCDMTGTTLLGTDLRSASMVGATGVDGDELAQAIIDAKTTLPPGVRRVSQRPSDSYRPSWELNEFVPVTSQREHGSLSEDFRYLEQHLLPQFREVRRRAAGARTILRVWYTVVLAVMTISATITVTVFCGFLANGAGPNEVFSATFR
jgi:uncharacterized protein YjbI with pentapeptide repeats